MDEEGENGRGRGIFKDPDFHGQRELSRNGSFLLARENVGA